MATDFFQRQSLARRYTRWLVVLFTLAVVGIVVVTFFVTQTVMENVNMVHRVGANRTLSPGVFSPGGPLHGPWQIPLLASGAALVLILGGSLFKLAQLRGGGTVVAERLGGRRIYPNTTDPLQRRVLNVVEEMALASGMPVPPVYFLAQEQGINAFAAGYTPSDAVVAVTRGCAELLTRDQLQGVIAHEFSHVLNGDMRLNIRLIGVLHGILILGLLGRVLLRSTAYSGRGRGRNDGVMILLLIGLAVLVLGSIGTLIGNLIKAAVSRQREYLADASAVQFTRNPGGIAGALKRIGATLSGSRLKSPNASEASHMFFSTGVWEGFTGLMATHPSLPKRIHAIDPGWDGKFPVMRAAAPRVGMADPTAAGLVGASQAAFGASPSEVPMEKVRHASDQVGHPTETHRQYAMELIRELPRQVVDAAHEPYGARAVIFGLLLDRAPAIRTVQMARLAELALPDVVRLTEKLSPMIDRIDTRARLPLVDMTLPALRAMAPPQYETFAHCFRELVAADQKIGLFEWTLHRVLLRHLQPQFRPVCPLPVRYYGLQRLADPCSILFSALAHSGNGAPAGNRPEKTSAAFSAATHLIPEVRLRLLSHEACSLAKLDAALKKLTRASAKQRRRLIDAAAACISADGEAQIREVELLRAVSDMLDCPMPPLLPGQPIRGGR
jgi:Zn-dependent protease with chaperone function